MREVYLHSCLLMLLDLLSLFNVKLNWLIRVFLPVSVKDVVWVVLTQHKATNRNFTVRETQQATL